jgi:hypothetical protein
MKDNCPVWNISIKVRGWQKNMWVTNEQAYELIKDEYFARYYPEDLTSIPKGYIGLYFTKKGFVRKVIVRG